MIRAGIASTFAIAFAIIVTGDMFGGPSELTPCEAYGAADAVFIGEARPRITRRVPVQIGPEPHIVIANFEFTPIAVERVFRGATSAVVYVSPQDMELIPSERYVVYGHDYLGVDMFMTQVRDGTKPASQATKDLEFLDVLLPNASGAAISGVLELDESDVNRIGTNLRPLANVVVRFSQGERAGTALTLADGHFTVNGLEPGTYTAGAQLPDDLALVKDPAPIVRVLGRGCASLLLRAVPNGRVRGVMRSLDGRPARSQDVALMRGDLKRGEPDGYFHNISTDDDGRFMFTGVRPGTYMLGRLSANVDGVIDPSVYYPGTLDREAAAVIVVGRSTDQDVGEFRVPRVR
jgi:hypothetical protein